MAISLCMSSSSALSCSFQLLTLLLHIVTIPVYIFVICIFISKRLVFDGTFYTFAIWLGICDIVHICVGLSFSFSSNHCWTMLCTIWLLGLAAILTFAIALNRLTVFVLMHKANSIWSNRNTNLVIFVCFLLAVGYAIPSAYLVTEQNDYGMKLIRNATLTVRIIQGQMITLTILAVTAVGMYAGIVFVIIRSKIRVGGQKFSKTELKVCIQAALVTFPVFIAAVLLCLMQAAVVSFHGTAIYFSFMVTISRVINPYIYLGINSSLQAEIWKLYCRYRATVTPSISISAQNILVQRNEGSPRVEVRRKIRSLNHT